MDSPKYLWIQTRDGSPTLWSNELGESFRSVKGAFLESWHAFVSPALRFIEENKLAKPILIGEFGLGPGTNWILSAVAAQLLGIDLEYHVIERDVTSFSMGLARWENDCAQILKFVSEQLGVPVSQFEFKDLAHPKIHPSLDLALQPKPAFLADIWYHDPFGFDVNPDGYSIDTLERCSRLWKPTVWGGSYACNRHFKAALDALPGISASTVLTGASALKRERLEFHRL